MREAGNKVWLRRVPVADARVGLRRRLGAAGRSDFRLIADSFSHTLVGPDNPPPCGRHLVNDPSQRNNGILLHGCRERREGASGRNAEEYRPQHVLALALFLHVAGIFLRVRGTLGGAIAGPIAR